MWKGGSEQVRLKFMSVASRSGFGVVIEGDVVDKCRNQKHSGVVVDPSLVPRCGILDMGSTHGDGGANPGPLVRASAGCW